MENKFTPGKWDFEIENKQPLIYGEYGVLIATVALRPPSESESKCTAEMIANAKLMAAAPELLQALIGLMDSINPHDHPQKKWDLSTQRIGSKHMPEDSTITTAIAAIKKATDAPR